MKVSLGFHCCKIGPLTFIHFLHTSELHFKSRWLWLQKGCPGPQEENFDVAAHSC